jgi:hypothetical protein
LRKGEGSGTKVQAVKKWLLIGAGFGAGAVLMAALLVGGGAWYSSRKKTWNVTAIHTSFSADVYTVDENCNVIGMQIRYLVENKTSKDYTLPEHTFMILDSDGLSTSVSGKYKLEHACFIPAGNKVKCSVIVPVDYDTDNSLTGFVIFDPSSRYKVEFPKPLRPSAKLRQETLDHFAKLKLRPPTRM